MRLVWGTTVNIVNARAHARTMTAVELAHLAVSLVPLLGTRELEICHDEGPDGREMSDDGEVAKYTADLVSRNRLPKLARGMASFRDAQDQKRQCTASRPEARLFPFGR